MIKLKFSDFFEVKNCANITTKIKENRKKMLVLSRFQQFIKIFSFSTNFTSFFFAKRSETKSSKKKAPFQYKKLSIEFFPIRRRSEKMREKNSNLNFRRKSL